MVKGIIRRLDDLGRVVIPKEYRKMYNIDLGDPMEIFALDNGDIVVRKVNLSSQLETAALPALSALSDNTGKTLLLSDTSSFIAGVGAGKSRLTRRELPTGVISALKEERIMNTTTANDAADVVLDDCGFDYFAMTPISCAGEVRGGLFMLSAEPLSESETVLLKTVSAIISNSLLKV